MEKERVAIIGAGMMGHGLAQIFAAGGYEVVLTDVNGELLLKALINVRTNMTFLADNGLGSREEIEPGLARIRTTTSLKEAVSHAQVVIEAVSENLGLKQKIFQDMEDYCPVDTILASNTSVISITEIAQRTTHKNRVVGTHFWFPPYLIPLVEVVKGRETSDETMDFTYDFMKRAGKHPIKCLKDVPGFVANRLQHALWREAISMVEHGIADAATVDDAIKHSFGIRLSVLGPLENADMAGLDLTLQIHNYILQYLESSPAPSAVLIQKAAIGELGMKSSKGFYDWTPDKEGELRKRLLNHLIEWNKKQKT
ncbi:MAG TPA: 3-hydroxyacyl-CoA dehydrogenase family protein [Syntrophorhabdaceae bacterium]|nr:3-hydroxyacyl-CoA dehydrogenase family protein [Syntrophorhabdaceae bacterium]